MYVNQGIAISTEKLVLVPYEAHHVPTYHEWMKDSEIQELTASEPLTLAEEYAMQKSWRQDSDKLTYIICRRFLPPDGKPFFYNSEKEMIGDINMFFSPDPEDPNACIGEIELMIAPTEERGKGYGRTAVLAFLTYVAMEQDDIMDEYAIGLRKKSENGNENASTATSNSTTLAASSKISQTPMSGASENQKENNPPSIQRPRLKHILAKISSTNVSSIKLFERLGFVKVSETPNYFGEVELIKEDFDPGKRMETIGWSRVGWGPRRGEEDKCEECQKQKSKNEQPE